MPVSQAARSAATAGLVALMLYLSGLLVLVSPLPILYASLARGRAAGLGAALLAGAFVAALYLVFPGPGAAASWAARAVAFVPLPVTSLAGFVPLAFVKAAGIIFFCFFAAVAMALAEGARRRLTIVRWGAAALAAGIAVSAAAAVAAWAVGVPAVLKGVSAYVLSTVRQVAELQQAAGGANAQMALLTDHAEEVAQLIVQLAPSFLFVGAVLTVALNLVVGRRLVRAHHALAHVHNVARFRLPDALIWALIGCGVAFFADRYALHVGWLSLVAANGAIALGVIYFLQGLAVVVYLLQGIRLPIFRAFAYIAMILFLQAASMALMVVGVADVWVDFRQRRWRALHQRQD